MAHLHKQVLERGLRERYLKSALYTFLSTHEKEFKPADRNVRFEKFNDYVQNTSLGTFEVVKGKLQVTFQEFMLKKIIHYFPMISAAFDFSIQESPTDLQECIDMVKHWFTFLNDFKSKEFEVFNEDLHSIHTLSGFCVWISKLESLAAIKYEKKELEMQKEKKNKSKKVPLISSQSRSGSGRLTRSSSFQSSEKPKKRESLRLEESLKSSKKKKLDLSSDDDIVCF